MISTGVHKFRSIGCSIRWRTTNITEHPYISFDKAWLIVMLQSNTGSINISIKEYLKLVYIDQE